MTLAPVIRDYEPGDERAWLETRVLAFLDTAYFDDVKRAKTALGSPAIEVVATESGRLTGILDIEIDDESATIDTIAVRPDAQRGGTGRRLLREGLRRLPDSVRSLDAWTRDDEGTNAWYLAMGFAEQQRYLHVYRSDEAEDPDDGFATPDGLSLPVVAFLHAAIDREQELRATYARVHVCRRYVLPATAWGSV